MTTFWSALMATKAFEDILPRIIVLEKGRGAAVALRAVLSRIGKGTRLSGGLGASNPTFVDGDIEVRNISFAYPSRLAYLVLQESTFFFPSRGDDIHRSQERFREKYAQRSAHAFLSTWFRTDFHRWVTT